MLQCKLLVLQIIPRMESEIAKFYLSLNINQCELVTLS